jgi:DNA-directed RNA polymerase beta subunit
MFNSKDLNSIVKHLGKVPQPNRNVVAKKTSSVKKQAAVKGTNKPAAQSFFIEDDDTDKYVPVGINGLLSASEKLLAINRGLDDVDERDSYAYKKLWGVDRHLEERIKLDAGKIRMGLMRNVVKNRNLKAAFPFLFDSYSKNLIVGDTTQSNPLSSPLEEINPMHILEQARRVTQMGPGGIGMDNAITEEAQAVHGSQFGFISTVEGPESEKIGIDTRLAWGTKIGSDGKIYQQFRNKKTGQLEWLSPSDLKNKVVKFPD